MGGGGKDGEKEKSLCKFAPAKRREANSLDKLKTDK